MKCSLWCLLAFVLCCGVEGWASFTLDVQTNNGGASTCTLTSVPAGDTIAWAGSTNGATSAISSVSDGSAYTQFANALPANNASLNERPDIWYRTNVSAGTYTITPTLSSGSMTHCFAVAFSNPSAISADSVNSSACQGVGANPTCTVTTSQAGDFVFSMMISDQNPTAGACCTFLTGSPGSSNWFESAEYSLSVSSGSVAIDYTASGPHYAIAVAAFKASGGGSTPKSVIVGGGIQ